MGKFLDPFQGFWQNAESGNEEDTVIEIPGLNGEVSVYFDSLQIPHVFSSTEEDLYFTQGYITARHRLWQMEFQTHAAAGRISEIIGEAALDFDRYNRRIGMVYAAENSLKSIEDDPTAKMVIDNYTNGINAYIKSLKPKDYPLEYKLLNYEPELWTNLKSALLLKYMSKTLNISEKDMEMTNALSVFGKDMLDVLYPDYEKVGDPIVDKTGDWNFDPIRIDSVPFALPLELIALHRPEKPSPDVGSNNWAVSGSKTSTGYPMLSNDPHLTLSLPSIWYIMHLNGPNTNAMGATLPGAPSII
ncbi:MAG: penicillin acylase family protein [Flammeovirgaceae bacterium]|nr:penicillin acylase family protein [Flammeovirgaceae bacterium]